MRKLLPAILFILLLAACTNSALRTQHSQLAKADSLCSVQAVQKVAVMGNDKNRARIVDKISLKPGYGGHIQLYDKYDALDVLAHSLNTCFYHAKEAG